MSSRKNWKAVGSYGTVGLEMVICVLIGFFGGRWLDGRLGTEPYLTALGFIFGLGAAIKGVRRAYQEMQYEAEHDGWRESETDRPARFALREKEAEREARSLSPGDSAERSREEEP